MGSETTREHHLKRHGRAQTRVEVFCRRPSSTAGRSSPARGSHRPRACRLVARAVAHVPRARKGRRTAGPSRKAARWPGQPVRCQPWACSSGLVPPFLGRLRWCFLNTKRKRDGRSKLRRSMCHTPRFVLSSWARACALTEGQRTAGAMAPHSRAPVERRRARTRARVMPGRLSPASYDPGSSSDAPGAGPTRPGRAVGTELICLGMRNRGSLL